jgi:ABC-2 type transport system permease protein
MEFFMKSSVMHIVKKEFIQIRKDKRMLGMSLIAPLIQLFLLGYAANIDIKNIPLAVCDMDNSKVSRQYIESVTNSGYFEKVVNVERMKDMDANIDDGKASIGIIIPKDFGKNIIAGKKAEIEGIIDGSDSNTATIGMNYLSMITTQYSQQFVIKKLERLKSKNININPQKIAPEIRIWYNPELKSKNFMVPGVLGMLLMVVTLILTSLAIVKEKEIGTLEQLIVTPLKSYELILGKLIPFSIIGIVDIILVLFVASLWFEIPIKGSAFLLFGFSVLFLLSTLGLGLFVSTVAGNQQQAMMISMFFIMLPMMYLSGFIFPIENMPKVIQAVTYIMPLRYYFNIVRGIFLKGVGFAELWRDALMLFIIGTGILLLSIKRFHKRLG